MEQQQLARSPRPLPIGDDPLVVLGQRWRTEHAKLATAGDSNEERGPIWEACSAIEDQMMRTQPTTLHGVAEKLALAVFYGIDLAEATFADLDWDQKWIVSAADDLKSLLGGSPRAVITGADAHLFDLRSAMARALARSRAATSDTDLDALVDEADGAARNIASTPAGGPAGVLLKMRVLAGFLEEGFTDMASEFVASIRADLTAMGGRPFADDPDPGPFCPAAWISLARAAGLDPQVVHPFNDERRALYVNELGVIHDLRPAPLLGEQLSAVMDELEREVPAHAA